MIGEIELVKIVLRRGCKGFVTVFHHESLYSSSIAAYSCIQGGLGPDSLRIITLITV